METLTVTLAYIIVFALGASIGSFLNVVVYRIPANISILWPPSRCPHCLHKLGKRENIPVLGWILLKGRCRHCKTKISPRYPLVEAITGIIFLLVFARYDISIETLGYWSFLSWLLALSLIDLDTMTLPNPLTQSGLIAGLLFQGILGFAQTSQLSGISSHLMTGIIGGVVGIWLFDIISFSGSILFRKTVMGGGDAKLAAMMGAWLGWKYLLLSGFLACLVGAFGGGGAIALKLINRQQPIPFGPFLALGAALTLFCGEAILSTYLHLFFPIALKF
ncbi:MAG TPA: prepilin peptidase [Cyanobacteria bacterium UBA11149]|nr:prepilin peptidase [Cyanobacteria bacterium UBA11367]HBE56339.1 prepilin peptidase [Cyanobacteria bacterium UBA11366]HBK65947.1 prepilin peptidase [Cyanobacteria bacterium UBA11166]HBR76258.1 prepilin peptidase [Cyanobacteria bacterium UBA11159]HBS70493.1 prepilin peptidase [Cyanobacteria bacterium UBA11153]HBW91849.1 prepilin peptidase [Cyanobacteria bacterium UBA11149]HCA94779.1 prepilin peptidase [Cyanobacteria bacterium UBA9226]